MIAAEWKGMHPLVGLGNQSAIGGGGCLLFTFITIGIPSVGDKSILLMGEVDLPCTWKNTTSM